MVDPKKHYTLGELMRLEAFPASKDFSAYMRFIGTQATRGNYLTRDQKGKKKYGEFPFKGTDVNKFIENIK